MIFTSALTSAPLLRNKVLSGATSIMPKPIQSISAYSKYGVHRSLVSHLCMNNWNYPEIYKDTLTDYYLLQWEGSYFGVKLKEGTISSHDREYVVVYKNCTYFTAKNAKQVRLSFRNPQPEFDLPGYVIVSVFTE